MRSISICVEKNGAVTVIGDNSLLGYSGEHKAVTLSVTFSDFDESSFCCADYFRLVFDGYYSEELNISDGTLSYSVPSEAIAPPTVHCQLIGYKAADGEISMIAKSSVFEFSVGYSETPTDKVSENADVFERTLEKSRDYYEKAAYSAALAQNACASAEQYADNALSAADNAAGFMEQSEANCLEASGYAASAAASAADAAASAEKVENLENLSQQTANAYIIKCNAEGKMINIADSSECSLVSLTGLGENTGTDTQTVTLYDETITSTQPATFDGETDISVHLTVYCHPFWSNDESSYYSDMMLVPLIDGAALDAAGIATQANFEVGYQHDYHYVIDGTTLTITGQYYPDYTGSVITEIDPITVTVTEGAKITGFVLSGSFDEDQPILSATTTRTVTIGIANPVIKIFGKNLIPYPYADLELGTSTYNGVDFTVYEDGSILINGTATGNISKSLFQNTTDLLGLRSGITISSNKNASDNTQQANISLMCNYYDSTGTMKQGLAATSAEGSTGTITDNWIGLRVYLYIASGKAFNNLLIKPQIAIGDTADGYEPYREAQSVTVPYTFAEGDTLTVADGAVKTVIGNAEADITDTEAGQALLALHTNYPNTVTVSDMNTQIVYIADTKKYIDNRISESIALALNS